MKEPCCRNPVTQGQSGFPQTDAWVTRYWSFLMPGRPDIVVERFQGDPAPNQLSGNVRTRQSIILDRHRIDHITNGESLAVTMFEDTLFISPTVITRLRREDDGFPDNKALNDENIYIVLQFNDGQLEHRFESDGVLENGFLIKNGRAVFYDEDGSELTSYTYQTKTRPPRNVVGRRFPITLT